MEWLSAAEQTVSVEALGQTLRSLRLTSAKAQEQMRRSLSRHGQLCALSVYRTEQGALEVIDGFKRVQAAQELGLLSLRMRVVATSAVQAKVALPLLNSSPELSALEEGWLVRSLYRQDGLSQVQIGPLLGRHKSWVCRRLLLVEALDEAVQADVRLGLLCPSSARALARLPRGNQKPAARVVIRRGLTVRQAETLVSDVLQTALGQRDARLDEYLSGRGPSPSAAPRTGRSRRTVAEQMVYDVTSLTRLCGRLQARLLGQPLASYSDGGGLLVFEALCGLVPLLSALLQMIAQVQTTGQGGLDGQHPQSRRACVPDGDALPPGPVPPGHCAGSGDQPQHGAQDAPDAGQAP